MSRWRALPIAAVLALGSLTLPGLHAATPPGVAVDELSPVPADGIFHLVGHGYGNGTGLSQWGAEGGAETGANVDQILDHYYPGTTDVTAAPSTLRVLLSGVSGGGVPLWNAAGLTVTGADGTATAPAQDSAHARLRLVPVGNSLQLMSSPDGSSWSTEATVQAPATVGDSSAVIRVGQADGRSRDYRGSLTVSLAGGAAVAVNDVALEDYLRSVTPSESPPSWLPAALQAQAVAARTYAAEERAAAPAARAYDICDSTACQVYGGARVYPASGGAGTAIETPSTDSAVSATAGVERFSNGVPAFTAFGASDGGWTVDGSQPYLPAQPDPWDEVDAGNPSRAWTATVTAAQLTSAYPAVGTLDSLEVTRRDGHGDFGGRALTVILHGHTASGPTTVSTTGSSIAGATGLRSAWWQVGTMVLPGPAATPSFGVAAVQPRVVLNSARLTTSATRVVVAGRGGVPLDATAAFVIASTGPLSAATRANLLAWPSDGNRSGAVAFARLAAHTPSTGSTLVALGSDGALDLASSAGRLGVQLSVVGWLGPDAATSVQPADTTPFNRSVKAGTATVKLRPPAGATAALAVVTTSGTAGGSVSAAGAPLQSVTPAAQSTTTLLPLGQGATLRTSRAAHVRMQVIGWLTGSAPKLQQLQAVSEPVAYSGSRGGLVLAGGGAVPVSATGVLALVTGTAAVAGDVTLTPHASSSPTVRVALPPGRGATALVFLPLRDDHVVVRPMKKGAHVQLTVLGWR